MDIFFQVLLCFEWGPFNHENTRKLFAVKPYSIYLYKYTGNFLKLNIWTSFQNHRAQTVDNVIK